MEGERLGRVYHVLLKTIIFVYKYFQVFSNDIRRIYAFGKQIFFMYSFHAFTKEVQKDNWSDINHDADKELSKYVLIAKHFRAEMCFC